MGVSSAIIGKNLLHPTQRAHLSRNHDGDHQNPQQPTGTALHQRQTEAISHVPTGPTTQTVLYITKNPRTLQNGANFMKYSQAYPSCQTVTAEPTPQHNI